MRDIKRKEFLLPAIALAKEGGFPSLTPPRPPREENECVRNITRGVAEVAEKGEI